MPVDQRSFHSGVESAGQTLDALEAALEQKADCILCGDDEVAFEVMGELRTRHILVPNDLRVASLYDSSMLASITPSVSAVQYDAEQLARPPAGCCWTGWPEKRSSCGSWKVIRSFCGTLPSGGNAPAASNNALFCACSFPGAGIFALCMTKGMTKVALKLRAFCPCILILPSLFPVSAQQYREFRPLT